MSLSPSEKKTAVLAILNKIAPQANKLGGEALDSYPQTKTNFSHFDLTPGSDDIKAHGGKLLSKVVLATHFIDEFTADVQTAWDKFLTEVSAVLISKYR